MHKYSNYSSLQESDIILVDANNVLHHKCGYIEITNIVIMATQLEIIRRRLFILCITLSQDRMLLGILSSALLLDSLLFRLFFAN